MQQATSKINVQSAPFKKNYEGMLGLVRKLQKHMEESRFQGKEKHIERARKRGKLLARERIEYLLERNSPFLELLPLAGMQIKGGFGAGGTSASRTN